MLRTSTHLFVRRSAPAVVLSSRILVPTILRTLSTTSVKPDDQSIPVYASESGFIPKYSSEFGFAIKETDPKDDEDDFGHIEELYQHHVQEVVRDRADDLDPSFAVHEHDDDIAASCRLMLEEIKELDHEMKLAVSDLHRMQDDARRRHGANSYLVEEMKEVENKISKAMNKVRRIEDDVYKFSAKA
jgi:hypothetical protein